MINSARAEVDGARMSAAMREIARRSDAATVAALQAGAGVVRQGFISHSSGRPGPNRVSGTHQGSFAVVGPRPLGTGRWVVDMGPTARYSRRLELGPTSGGARYESLGPALEWARGGPLMSVFVAAWRRSLG